MWAGLAVLSGWLVRRARQAFVAGITACTFALLAHYGLGRIFGVFQTDVWASNSYWFLAAIVAGGPLGLIGAAARQPSLLGVAARLVVPVAAVLEPFVVGMLGQPTILPWPDRMSSVVTGSILLATGIAGMISSLLRSRREHTRTVASAFAQEGRGNVHEGMTGSPPDTRRGV
jgi:hypothetical protein